MSFTTFLRALLCLPAGKLSHNRNRAKHQRRGGNNQPHKDAQLPARRWCDPTENTTRPAVVAAPPATYNPQPRSQHLVPAKPLRPVKGHTSPAQEKVLSSSKALPPLPHLPAPVYNDENMLEVQEAHEVATRPLRKPAAPRRSPTQGTMLSPRRRLSSVPRLPSSIAHIQKRLGFQQVKEVIAIIGKSFPHIPCAVTGLAAMVHHGFNKRLPKEVYVSFPARDLQVVRSWALSQGLLEVQGKSDCFGVTLPAGQIGYIKVRILHSGFETLRTVKAGDRDAFANVLNLQTIAVQIARGYVAGLGSAHHAKQEIFAGDMRWALRVMKRSKKTLCSFYARHIVQHQFWEPFTLSFPDTIPLFANVGLGFHEVEALRNELQQD